MTTGGFVVPEDYLKIAHGYATTSHSSQGLTANFAVVFGASFDQKAIYVSHSRAREHVDTFVPSKEAFLTRAERAQGERLGVLEAIADTKSKNDGPANGFKVGDSVTWNYEARGGYGYFMAVPGVVTKLAGKRVEIAVPSQSKQARTRVGSITLPDSQWIRVTRWVKPEKLAPRHTRASPEEIARLIESEPERKPMDKIQVRQIDDPEWDRAQREEPERQYLTVPYAEREEAKVAGAKWVGGRNSGTWPRRNPRRPS